MHRALLLLAGLVACTAPPRPSVVASVVPNVAPNVAPNGGRHVAHTVLP